MMRPHDTHAASSFPLWERGRVVEAGQYEYVGAPQASQALPYSGYQPAAPGLHDIWTIEVGHVIINFTIL